MNTSEYSSFEYDNVTGDRWLSIVREQGRRIEAQRAELSKLNRISKRDIEAATFGEAFYFLLKVLIRKLKIW